MPSENVVLKCLADPTRRALFERLFRDGEQSVHVLTRHAGVSQPMVSKHLKVLQAAGLTALERRGRESYYRIAAGSLSPLQAWLNTFSAEPAFGLGGCDTASTGS